jgi:hypothetical protein
MLFDEMSEDEIETAATEGGGVLVVPPRAETSDDLNVRELAYRNAPIGANFVISCQINEQTGEEEWEPTTAVDHATGTATTRYLDAEPFQKAMGLSRLPTIAEAMAFLIAARSGGM